MHNWIIAIAKAVSKAVGPLGWPIELAVSLYDEKQVESRNKTLQGIIFDNQRVTEEALNEIFAIKEKHEHLVGQLVTAIRAVTALAAENKEELKLLNGHPVNDVTDSLTSSISREKNRFTNAGMVTELGIVNELTYLFLDPELFLLLVSNWGFPEGSINSSTAPKKVYFQFVRNCRGLSLKTRADVFRALADEKPGGKILNLAADLYEEMARNES